VAETTRFCDNPDTPRVGGGRVIYASKDGAKRFEIDRAAGSVRFVFDTEAEWRNGCNLSLPWNGAEPRYLGGRAWNWPHFLLSQAIVDPHAEDGRLRPGRYEEVLLAFQAELLDSAKGKPAQCPPGSWGGQRIPDHCLFYAALVLLRESPRPPEGVSPARIYALYPLFYSEGGERYDVPLAPWLGDDPAEAAVYFTPNHVCLEQGRAVDVSIDAPGLLEEAVGFINARHDAALRPGDYYLESLLIGWEVWGAYRTELRLGGLSLKASSGAASGT
jgi:hypothetical protein